MRGSHPQIHMIFWVRPYLYFHFRKLMATKLGRVLTFGRNFSTQLVKLSPTSCFNLFIHLFIYLFGVFSEVMKRQERQRCTYVLNISTDMEFRYIHLFSYVISLCRITDLLIYVSATLIPITYISEKSLGRIVHWRGVYEAVLKIFSWYPARHPRCLTFCRNMSKINSLINLSFPRHNLLTILSECLIYVLKPQSSFFNRGPTRIVWFRHRKKLFSQALRFHPCTATSIDYRLRVLWGIGY